MNVKWIKQNLAVVIAVGVFVLLLAGAIWLQLQTSARGTELEAELAGQRARLQGLLSAKPFPARENIDVIRRDYDRLSQQYQALTQAVSRSSIQVPDLRPVTFSQQLTKTLDRLAKDAGNARVTVPSPFAYGFSRYVTTLPASNLPEAEQKRMLGLLYKQLLVVEKLSELLFNSHVQEIKAIRRVEVEPGTASPDALDATIMNDPKVLHQTLPFEFEFVCSTETLRAFLNSLSQSDLFFAIRTLKVDTGSTTGGGQPSVKATEGGKLVVTARISLVEFPSATQKPGP
jgi:hypothetical protein